MSVAEFLRHVRRIVVDFVVGRVLSGNGDADEVSALDDVTTYYLLHRHDFGMKDAPIGACILYALSCNVSDGDLVNQYDILVRKGSSSTGAMEDEGSPNRDDDDESAAAGGGSQVKLKPWKDQRSRIQEQAINAEALLPEGPYDLWREGETSRLAKDLIGAFAQLPHLPKMLRRQDIVDTLALGAESGLFVLRATRPDRSTRTLWRQRPTEADLKDAGLEVVLPAAAELTELPPGLLAPGELPDLWPSPPEIEVADVIAYFEGGKVVQIEHDGYTEPMTIPKATREVVETATRTAVEEGHLSLLSGPASLYKEPLPAGVLSDAATLLPPPAAIPVGELLPETLPDAWEGEEANGLAMSVALSNQAGRTLPWSIVRDAIEGAVRSRMLERTVDSGEWPCDLNGAQQAKFHVPAGPGPGIITPPPPKPGVRVGTAELRPGQIQDLADVIGDVKAAAAGHDLTFRMTIELSGELPLPEDVVAKVSELLKGVSEDLEMK